MTEQRICVGQFMGAHGVHGALKFKSFTDVPADVFDYLPLADEQGKTYSPDVVREEGEGVFVVTLKGLVVREEAALLRGKKLFIPKSRLPEAAADEFYYGDLVGLSVEDEQGGALGTVSAVHDFGAGDVLEVARAGLAGNTFFLPFTKEAVPSIDIAAGKIICSSRFILDALREREEK